MKVKKVTIRDLLIAKGINPETADFKDIFGILDVTNDTEQASTIAKLKADNAKLREALITIAKYSDNGIFIVKKNVFRY